MSRLYFRDEPEAGASSLAKVALAVAAGAVIGTRARMGGTLVLAGLASWWLSRQRKRCESEAGLTAAGLAEQDLPAPAQAQPLEAALPVSEVCVPTAPFVVGDIPANDEAGGASETALPSAPPEASLAKPCLEDLRSSLQPPASLFQPLSEPPVSGPLESAPVFVEVAEQPPQPASHSEPAILPDSITIPVTPDPPSELLTGSAFLPELSPPASLLSSGPVPNPRQPVIVPKAGMPQPPPAAASGANPAAEALPPAPESSTPPVPRKNFIEWLREGRGIE